MGFFLQFAMHWYCAKEDLAHKYTKQNDNTIVLCGNCHHLVGSMKIRAIVIDQLDQEFISLLMEVFFEAINDTSQMGLMACFYYIFILCLYCFWKGTIAAC